MRVCQPVLGRWIPLHVPYRLALTLAPTPHAARSGALVNWGFCAHAISVAAAAAGSLPSAALGWSSLPLRCWAPVGFFSLFGLVIALLKDVPDIKGDRQFGIRSFSVRVRHWLPWIAAESSAAEWI